ncbi:hypothetical protein SSABA_v1c01780 [Spiroplasma sabaudiense Ar-1343]|uniref:Uncharacterized protein n=1 Tax=Spiroplasma sabaudiense Ar-1343 TaxID=1276257 RepID=W6A9M4_9MOLU|nr:hypothetical protein [Spiroplasma sabaudiense]AHI53590.1 hypothetical protein SSABA_v1c01780 [Spiroplasma sabaudiense Ar-1343]
MKNKIEDNSLAHDVVYKNFLEKYFHDENVDKIFRDLKLTIFGKRMKKPILEIILLTLASIYVISVGIIYFFKAANVATFFKNDFVFLFISLSFTALILLRIGSLTLANYKINDSFISSFWTNKYCEMEKISPQDFNANKVYDLIFLDLMDKIDHKKFPNLTRLLYSCFYTYLIFIVQILILANMSFDEEGTKSVIEIVIPTIDSFLIIYISKDYIKSLALYYRDREFKLVEYINFFDINNIVIEEMTKICEAPLEARAKLILNFQSSIGKLRKFELYTDLGNILNIMTDNSFTSELDLKALKYYIFITNLALAKILINTNSKSENIYIMKLFIDEAIK